MKSWKAPGPVVLFRLVSLPVLLLSAALAYPDREADRPRFLVLNSYHAGFAWSDGILYGIWNVLSEEFDHPSIHLEFMDTKRHFDGDDGPYLEALADLYARKYAGVRFDAILCSDDTAFLFLLERGQTLFPDVPVVFTGVNNYSPRMLEGRTNFTGVVEWTDFAPSIDLGLKLQPRARRLGIVTDASLNGAANRKKFESLAEAYEGRLEFVFFGTGGLPELLGEIAAFDPEGLIYFSDFYLDSRGRPYDYDVSVPAVLDAAPCPVLYHVDMYIPFGVVGGSMNRSGEYGEMAAHMAARIVRGEAVSDIPVVDQSLARIVVNYPALRRHRIPEANIPPGAIVLGKPESFFRRNADILLISGLIMLCLCVIIASLLYTVRQRERSERNLEASREAILASLREKEVLLQEVHHRVKNNLQIVTSLLRLQASGSPSEEVKTALSDSVERILAMALVHERLYLSESLSDIDFENYVSDLVESIRNTFDLSGIDLQCGIKADGARIGLDMSVPLGLILNELLTNSVKYALAGRCHLSVRVEIRKDDGLLFFRYADDGPGFPEGFDPERQGNLGLTLVRALGQQLRGKTRFPRGPEGGMAFEVDIPLQ